MRGSPAGSGEAPGPGRGGEVGSGARVEGGEAVQLADGLVAGVVPGPRHLHEALADVRQRGALARAGQDCKADEAGVTIGMLLNVCIVATAGHWTRDTTHVCVGESRSRVGLQGMESCVSAL